MIKKLIAAISAVIISLNLIFPYTADARMPMRPPGIRRPAAPPQHIAKPRPPINQRPAVRRPPHAPDYHKKLTKYKLKHRQRAKMKQLRKTAERMTKDYKDKNYKFKYSGKQYTHGYYRAYYKNHLHVMYSDKWIKLIGLDKFTKMIDDKKMTEDKTVVVNASGKIIGLNDKTLSKSAIVLDQDEKKIPIIDNDEGRKANPIQPQNK